MIYGNGLFSQIIPAKTFCFGIIFDTDVDRVAAVDHQGNELTRNRMIALISAIVLQEHPGSTIVTDSITSDGLTQFIEQNLGGQHHRFKRGYKTGRKTSSVAEGKAGI